MEVDLPGSIREVCRRLESLASDDPQVAELQQMFLRGDLQRLAQVVERLQRRAREALTQRPLEHITRAHHRPGWVAKLPAWHPEGPRSAHFSDVDYGGADAAMREACYWRDEQFDAAGLPLVLASRVNNRNSRTGLVGLRLSYRADRPALRAWSWTSRGMTERGYVRRQFPLSEFDFEEALVRAVQYRHHTTGIGYGRAQLEHALELKQVVNDQLRTGSLPSFPPPPANLRLAQPGMSWRQQCEAMPPGLRRVAEALECPDTDS